MFRGSNASCASPVICIWAETGDTRMDSVSERSPEAARGAHATALVHADARPHASSSLAAAALARAATPVAGTPAPITGAATTRYASH